MPKKNTEILKTELVAAKVKGSSHTLKEAIPVTINLDNGETYKGLAFEARPDGLVMVHTDNCDLGVQLSNISKA